MKLLQTSKYALTILLILAATPAWAYVMSSTSYRIQRDSINVGGGLSTSTSYSSESTIGGFGSGSSSSTSYNLSAGYQQMEQTAISLTVPATASMSPRISGAAGGTATAETTLNVMTDSSSGYTLQIKASTSPAMKSSGSSFADYTLAAAAPDYAWSVSSTAAEFGYSPEGVNIVTRYKDSLGACNQAGGSDTANACWDSFTTAYNTVSQSAASNSPSGATTTVKFRAEAGSAANQPDGSYTATVIFTAFTN